MSVEIRPASTVVLLRDGEQEMEVLMVRRNRALAFAGGFWVFPGGAVDAADREQGGDDADEAARVAAAREAEEEAGVCPDPEAMVLVSHWTTPVGERKRFSTWIFAGEVAPDSEVVIDGSEIHDYQWIGVKQALDTHKAGELPMMPPTFITLCAVARYDTASEALAGERETPCPRVLPLLVPLEGEGAFATLYPGDAAYESGDLEAEGPRHRAFLSNGSWQYVYEGVSEPPLYPQD
ncbi:NUDIX hydrolase [Congregibacter sp.]|uniref:NUDIX hydrolase n=1 Tax=Congregibacter sp. TaxID=2744308 RepID=UPI0038596C4C